MYIGCMGGNKRERVKRVVSTNHGGAATWGDVCPRRGEVTLVIMFRGQMERVKQSSVRLLQRQRSCVTNLGSHLRANAQEISATLTRHPPARPCTLWPLGPFQPKLALLSPLVPILLSDQRLEGDLGTVFLLTLYGFIKQ